MKLSLNWLREWVAFDETPAELATRLTLAGLEGEALPQPGRDLAGILAGKIIAAVPHPQADRLQVCTVEVGQAQPLTIVCGASNARVGVVVPCATVGTVLPNGITITQANLRGVDSAGMLCSAEELGLVDKADGLLELDDNVRPGTPVAEHLALNDTILALELTPNRGDCLSVLGLAREVSALTDIPMRRPSLPPAVVARAQEVLRILEQGEQSGALAQLADDLPLFSASPPPAARADEPSALEQALAEVNPDELSPRDALETLYRLKGLV